MILHDRYGLFSELNMPMPKPLFIGGNQDYIINLGMGIVASPLFQGTMQATGGLIEAVAGGGLIAITEGAGTTVGCAVMAHGLDHFYTGMNTAITGTLKETATSQLLQQAGMSPLAADFVDTGISVFATLGATSALKGPSLITRSWKGNTLALQPLANLRKAVPFQSSLPKATATLELEGLGKTTTTVNAQVCRNVDFICGSNGINIPTSRTVLEAGLQRAGFPSFITGSRGRGYILSNKLQVRIMEPSGQAPLRASFTYPYQNSPINPFTGKPP